MVRGVGAQVRGHGLAAQDGVDREMALHRVPTGEQVHGEHCRRVAGGVDDVREQLGWEVRQMRLCSHAWPLFRGPAGCHRPGCLHAVARRAPPNALCCPFLRPKTSRWGGSARTVGREKQQRLEALTKSISDPDLKYGEAHARAPAVWTVVVDRAMWMRRGGGVGGAVCVPCPMCRE